MIRAGLLLGVVLLSLPPGALATTAAAGEAGVRRVEALVGEARFREAVREAAALRPGVLALAPSSRSRRLLVRTELAAGTAALALGQAGTARSCFLRALQIEPSLALSPSTPPKVRRVLDALREGGA
jgi:hypothetical protein